MAADCPSARKGCEPARFGWRNDFCGGGRGLAGQLKSGPLEVKRARLFLNWNASPKSKELSDWLRAVKAAGLTPLITLRECEPTPEESTCPTKKAPPLGEYYNHAKTLIKALVNGTSETPAVRLWGSWNEPDHNGNAFHKDPQGPITAAYLWGETQRAAENAGCNHHCTVVAGEFAAYLGHHDYVSKYETTIIQAERKHHFPVQVKPYDWGIHDYNDLEQVKGVKEGGKEVLGNYVNKEAQGFVRETKKLYQSAHIWLTEQGARIQAGKVSTRLYGNPVLQRLAAQDFLRLGRPSEHTEWVYYYLYHGPTVAKILEHPHEFDSALLPGKVLQKKTIIRPKIPGRHTACWRWMTKKDARQQTPQRPRFRARSCLPQVQ